jgi:hypothetical protein
MLGDFPHEGFADLQFFRMISNSPPLDLEPLGLASGAEALRAPGADPVIRVMHSYPVGRSLGYLTEWRLGKGRLLVSALGLDQSWPEARHLLAQLCRYLSGARPSPAPVLSRAAIESLMSGTAL